MRRERSAPLISRPRALIRRTRHSNMPSSGRGKMANGSCSRTSGIWINEPGRRRAVARPSAGHHRAAALARLGRRFGPLPRSKSQWRQRSMMWWPQRAEAIRRSYQTGSRPSHASLSPAVSQADEVFDAVETGIGLVKFLADALDEGSDIGTIALCAGSGDEVLAVDEVINLAVADVLPRLLG